MPLTPNTRVTCLYVEDDALSRDVMQMMMRRVPQVTDLVVFEDSTDFMARIEVMTAVPGLILLDIHVQPLDGFTMLKHLRDDARFDESRIIALTASVMNEEVAQLRTSGFDGAIAKPLSLQTFPSLISSILEGESIWHIV